MSSDGGSKKHRRSSRKSLRKSSINAGFRGSLVTALRPSVEPADSFEEGAAKPRKSTLNVKRKSSRRSRASFKKSYVRYVRKSKKSFTRISICRRSSLPKRKSSLRRRKSDPGSTQKKSSTDNLHEQPASNNGFRGSLRLSVGLLPNVQGKRSSLNTPREPPSLAAPLSARGSILTITGDRVIVSREGKRESQLNQGFRGSLCNKRFLDQLHGSFTLLDYKEPPRPTPDVVGVGVFEPTTEMPFVIPEPDESPESSSIASPKHPGTDGCLKNAGFRQASLGGHRPSAAVPNEPLSITGTTRPYTSRDLAVPHFRGSLTKTGRRESIHIHPRL